MSSAPSLKYSKRIAALGAASAAVLSLGTASAAVTTIDANVLIGSSGIYEFNFVPNGSSYATGSSSYPGSVIYCFLWLYGRSPDLQWSDALLTEGSVIDATGNYAQSRFFGVPAQGVTVYGGYRYSDTENGRDYFGYVTITGAGGNSFTVDSYTYESTPNTPISIGAIPEPSAALLALAGAGLFFRRRRA